MHAWRHHRFAGTGRRFLLVLLSACASATALAVDVAPGDAAAASAAAKAKVMATDQPKEPATTVPLRWSDPATWNGRVPSARADVVVPAGKTLVLDQSPAPVGALKVAGTLVFADVRDLQFSAASITVVPGGAIEVGTAQAPFRHQLSITLDGRPVAENDGEARGLRVLGGALHLYGPAPSPVWTKLDDHAAAGTKALTLAEPTDWKAGDQIVVGPTDYYGINPTEKLTLASASGNAVSTTSELEKFRWGKLQYMSNTGLRLTPDPTYAPPALPAPTILDERAAVGNLSRHIVIQGADDDAWRAKGFGAHLMVMDLASRVVIDGVEFRRAGQAGVTGRYPVHLHMLSYGMDDGKLLGDADTVAVRHSTVSGSANRCIVLHGTNGVAIADNICHDIRGHAYFLEDAVERRNTLTHNLSLLVRNPPPEVRLQKHEGDLMSGGSSGFWITNPDNTMTGNLAADSQGNGIWMAFPVAPLGLSAKVRVRPAFLLHAPFEDNVANSNRKPGMQMQQDPCSPAGDVCLTMYTPTVDDGEHENFDGKGFDTSYRRTVELKRTTLFKNGDGAYRNRVNGAHYTEWVTADNPSVQLAGAANGAIERGLFIGYSLNNATPLPSFAQVPPSALATYAQRVADSHNVIYNFPFVDGHPSGMFDMEDYYLSPVIRSTARSVNNRLIESSPGYRVVAPNLWSTPNADHNNFTLASAIWDPYGLAGPNGNYWVYDVPFLTSGAHCVPVPPAGKNGSSCDGEYYGITSFVTDFSPDQYMPKMPIDVARLDDQGREIGRWTIPDGNTSRGLANMRHFAARTGGTYVLRMPGVPTPKLMQMVIANAYRPSDTFLLGMAFDGTRTIHTAYLVAGADQGPQTAKNWSEPRLLASKRTLRPAESLDEVKAGDGSLMWQDKANNLVWFKFVGSLPYVVPESQMPKDSSVALMRPYAVVVDGR